MNLKHQKYSSENLWTGSREALLYLNLVFMCENNGPLLTTSTISVDGWFEGTLYRCHGDLIWIFVIVDIFVREGHVNRDIKIHSWVMKNAKTS